MRGQEWGQRHNEHRDAQKGKQSASTEAESSVFSLRLLHSFEAFLAAHLRKTSVPPHDAEPCFLRSLILVKRAVNEKREDEWICQAEQRLGGGSWRVEGAVSHTCCPWVALYSLDQPHVYIGIDIDVYSYQREQRFHAQHILQQFSTLYSSSATSMILYFNYLFYISSTWQSPQEMLVYSPGGNIITVSSHVKSCQVFNLTNQVHALLCLWLPPCGWLFDNADFFKVNGTRSSISVF